MDKDKNTENNILILKQNADKQNQPQDPVKNTKNQSNPIYKTLLKFVHGNITDKKKPKSFFRFDPKDLF